MDEADMGEGFTIDREGAGEGGIGADEEELLLPNSLTGV